jgi:hypothetical protein
MEIDRERMRGSLSLSLPEREGEIEGERKRNLVIGEGSTPAAKRSV